MLERAAAGPLAGAAPPLYVSAGKAEIPMNAVPVAKPKDAPASARFQWDDPFLLDEQLTVDERMIRDTARAFAQDKLLPRVIEA